MIDPVDDSKDKEKVKEFLMLVDPPRNTWGWLYEPDSNDSSKD
jgi:hypothetical protein